MLPIMDKGGFMNRKHLVAFIGVLALMVAFAGVAAAEDKCPMCGMTIAGNENTAFVVTMKAGDTVTYCCSHCGLWVMAKDKDKVQSAKVRDFISGEWIDAAKAFYVFKSKAVPACAPSWLAFGSKKEAEMFKKGFGGKIYAYADALKERVKHPMGMEMSK
jgi:nitrous oxide reductase accessory protein NosL